MPQTPPDRPVREEERVSSLAARLRRMLQAEQMYASVRVIESPEGIVEVAIRPADPPRGAPPSKRIRLRVPPSFLTEGQEGHPDIFYLLQASEGASRILEGTIAADDVRAFLRLSPSSIWTIASLDSLLRMKEGHGYSRRLLVDWLAALDDADADEENVESVLRLISDLRGAIRRARGEWGDVYWALLDYCAQRQFDNFESQIAALVFAFPPVNETLVGTYFTVVPKDDLPVETIAPAISPNPIRGTAFYRLTLPLQGVEPTIHLVTLILSSSSLRQLRTALGMLEHDLDVTSEQADEPKALSTSDPSSVNADDSKSDEMENSIAGESDLDLEAQELALQIARPVQVKAYLWTQMLRRPPHINVDEWHRYVLDMSWFYSHEATLVNEGMSGQYVSVYNGQVESASGSELSLLRTIGELHGGESVFYQLCGGSWEEHVAIGSAGLGLIP